jgi:maltodextrin utilization protein YvdJ
MKPKTLLILIVLTIISLGPSGYGQEKFDEFMTETSPDDRAQLQTDYMKESLSLTRDQETKIQEVNLKYAGKMQEAYEAPTKRQQKLKAMRAINVQKEAELKLILSPDQYVIYEKNKEAMKEKIKARAKEKESEN